MQQKIPALKAKFIAMNVDRWGIFTRIAPDFVAEEAHRRIIRLVRSSRNLVHMEGMDRAQAKPETEYQICGNQC